MWHTGVSRISPWNVDAGVLEGRARRNDVRNAQSDVRDVRRELAADLRRIDEIQADVPEVELRKAGVRADQGQPERLVVERSCPLHVLHRHGDEVRALDRDQPTDPSIWSWISRFISTAYSSGSSFVIGSTKPDTIIALASDSESPRDMR